MNSLGVIVPCFNEAQRLNFDFFHELSQKLNCYFIFVDDGSIDETLIIIRNEIDQRNLNAQVLPLLSNQGKARAISKGVELALELGLKHVVFCDADNSVVVEDIVHLYSELITKPDLDIISGARVPLAGSNVIRKDLRKWAGRVVATIIAQMTNIAIYDPMSPLKIYRLKRLQSAPRYIPSTKWLGEVELMFHVYNIDRDTFRIEEVPINYWRDQEGGHIGLHSLFVLVPDFLKLRKRISGLGNKPKDVHRTLKISENE